jgi:hypothetical protein
MGHSQTLERPMTKTVPSGIFGRLPVRPFPDFAVRDHEAANSPRQQPSGPQTAGLDIDGGAAKFGVSCDSRQVETSQLQAIDPAAQRRASDLIRLLSEQDRSSIYKDSGAWPIVRLVQPLQRAMESWKTAWRDGVDPIFSETRHSDSKAWVEVLSTEMKEELDNLHGRVVIEGPWRVAGNASGVMKLEQDFFPETEPKATTQPAVSSPFPAPIVFGVMLKEQPFLTREPRDFGIFGTVLSFDHSHFDIKPLPVFY